MSFFLTSVPDHIFVAGIPRLLRISGHQLAAEMLLLGRDVSAIEARDRFRLWVFIVEHHNLPTPTFPSVNEVVPRGKAVETAISWAMKICENSPDAVQATKHGLVLSLLRGSVEEAFTSHAWSEASKKTWAGKNINVGRLSNDYIFGCSPMHRRGSVHLSR